MVVIAMALDDHTGPKHHSQLMYESHEILSLSFKLLNKYTLIRDPFLLTIVITMVIGIGTTDTRAIHHPAATAYPEYL